MLCTLKLFFERRHLPDQMAIQLFKNSHVQMNGFETKTTGFKIMQIWFEQ